MKILLYFLENKLYIYFLYYTSINTVRYVTTKPIGLVMAQARSKQLETLGRLSSISLGLVQLDQGLRTGPSS